MATPPGYPFMVTPAPQPPGVHFIQGDYLASDTVPTVATVAFPIAQTAGNLNIVAVGWRSSYNVSVNDSANNTYVLAVGPTTFNAWTQAIYYAKNISAAASNSVTVAFTRRGQAAITQIAADVRIAEYSGLNTTSPLDVVAAAGGTSTTADSGFATTTNQNDLLVGAGMGDGVIAGAGAHYTLRIIPINSDVDNSDILEDRIVTAAGSYDATAAMAGSKQFLMQMVALKEAANQAPVVNAGPNQTITLPTNTVTLHGTATDDGLPNNTLTIAWTQVSGPGTVTFNTPSQAVTDASFPVAGTYVLQLTANDSQLSSSSNVTVTVTSSVSLSLSPPAAGPNVTGTSQTLTALLKTGTGPTATPIAGVSVQFAVTGPNATSGSSTTNASGAATFTYTGISSGTDTVTASYLGASSNSASVSWLVPVQDVSTGTILGRFFVSGNSGQFNTPPTATPAFTEYFPTIDFNPPAGTVPGTPSSINVNTRPFTDVTTDINGNFTGSIVAQGNGYQAAVGPMFTFQAVFTGLLTIKTAGNKTINFYSDDGFIVGIGGGATRVSGPMVNVPSSGTTPFYGLTVMGAYNTNTVPVANAVVVNFPTPGTYPYEVDYSECCGGQDVLTMAVGGTSSSGVPPAGTLYLSPISPNSLNTGQTQTFTLLVTDASGAAQQNVTTALAVSGANQRQLTATTDATGHATFQYTGTNAGTDTLQATADVSGMGEYSNVVNMTWTVTTGGGSTVFAPQGWIGSPSI
ncbi:MAG: Ig-like domain-containing protein, partial [Acidobacteria bacterium]|nr:Ig-like domain-containing protein [Acidobacteriota bacterium]